MKVVLLVFATLVVVAGLSAAPSTGSTLSLSSHFSASHGAAGPMGLPIPQCGPGVPTCGE
jgi:hypothetical protein